MSRESNAAARLGPAPELRSLTRLAEAFCREYVVDHNGTAAAARAGYSAHSARWTQRDLLRHPQVRARIAEHEAVHTVAVAAAQQARASAVARASPAELERHKAAPEVELRAAAVLEELRRVAFSDVTEMFVWDEERCSFIPSPALTPAAASAIQSVKARTRRTVDEAGRETRTIELEIKTHPKTPALLALAKHFGIERADEAGAEARTYTIRVVRE